MSWEQLLQRPAFAHIQACRGADGVLQLGLVASGRTVRGTQLEREPRRRRPQYRCGACRAGCRFLRRVAGADKRPA